MFFDADAEGFSTPRMSAVGDPEDIANLQDVESGQAPRPREDTALEVENVGGTHDSISARLMKLGRSPSSLTRNTSMVHRTGSVLGSGAGAGAAAADAAAHAAADAAVQAAELAKKHAADMTKQSAAMMMDITKSAMKMTPGAKMFKRFTNKAAQKVGADKLAGAVVGAVAGIDLEEEDPEDSPVLLEVLSKCFGEIYDKEMVEITPVIDPEIVEPLFEKRILLRRKLDELRWGYEHQCELAKKKGKPIPPRQTRRTGLLGLLGPKEDLIEGIAKELSVLQSQLDAARRSVLTGQRCEDAPLRRAAFVSFKCARDASIAAQAQHAMDPYVRQPSALSPRSDPPPLSFRLPSSSVRLPAPAALPRSSGWSACPRPPACSGQTWAASTTLSAPWLATPAR